MVTQAFSKVSCIALLLVLCTGARAQDTTGHSVARLWNEQLLEAIRNDFARPVVHARNLYHISAAMYDSWVLINRRGETALMGGAALPIDPEGLPSYDDPKAATEQAVSYAAYRLLRYRYRNSPGAVRTSLRAVALMDSLGYSVALTDTNYLAGSAAALGNYIAAQIIRYGSTDGSNEAGDFANLGYADPINPPLAFGTAFSIFGLIDPTRWQSLQFPGVVIDQSGNVVGGDGPLPFLGAEWGGVTPFAMTEEDRSMADPEFQFGNTFVYNDPGPPPVWTREDTSGLEEYRWNFELVLKWSSHLDPNDGVEWDISPGARGNLTEPYPRTLAEYRDFYLTEGGTAGASGRPLNPVTGQPYPPNIVPRGDYTRVLAEFWADGPASETPPGHWFAIWNRVMDHPLFERRIFGDGEDTDPLEYDVKSYLALGGAMHDAAISAWSVKGAYDYVRPITAIRYMAKEGQCTQPDDRNFSPYGLNYDPGYIEPLTAPGELQNSATLAQVQAYGWIGPDAIQDPATDVAGVGWINPTLWYPYQRPNFVTPNFAGYVSGHSTYSSAAAYVLEKFTGSPYFPGGVGEFVAKKNEFLVFEEGPSVDVVLQWATYRDASDQTSLSRIWGGIHPPVDDAPGRRMGISVGERAMAKVEDLFKEFSVPVETPALTSGIEMYPNPAATGGGVFFDLPTGVGLGPQVELIDLSGRVVRQQSLRGRRGHVDLGGVPPGVYVVRGTGGEFVRKLVVQ